MSAAGLRLFAALELPEAVRSALAAWRPRDPALRPVSGEALHVTLAFLGSRDVTDVAPVAGVLRACARPVGGLSVERALWLPARRPRVLAVALCDADGALGALQAAVAGGIAEAIDWRPEKRSFLPHVTVARVRAGAGSLSSSVSGSLAPPPGAEGFSAPALTLFRSLLSPRGARYEALERVGLVIPGP